MNRLWLILALPALAAAGPCSNTTPVATPGTLAGEGVVHRGVGPECPETWHIATADGQILWPVNDPAFQQEGLKVRFSARERSDMASICMAGTIVDVISIEKL
jgi:hypothetical protein